MFKISLSNFDKEDTRNPKVTQAIISCLGSIPVENLSLAWQG